MIWCSGSCEVHSLHDKKENWSSSCSSFVLLTEICIYGSIRWPWETTKKCPLANPHSIFIFLVTATRICHPHPHRAVKSFSLSYLLGSNVERNGIAIKLACLLHYPSGWKVISLSSRWSWMDAARMVNVPRLLYSTCLSVCLSICLAVPTNFQPLPSIRPNNTKLYLSLVYYLLDIGVTANIYSFVIFTLQLIKIICDGNYL